MTFKHILKNIIGPLVPYITLGLGLLVWQNAWVAITFYHLGMISIVLLLREKLSLSILVRSSNIRLPLLAAMGGLLGGILLYLLWPLLAIPSDINSYLNNIGLTSAAWPFFFLYFVLLNPWIEEYYWRLFLSSDSRSLILNDFFFSGYHLLVLAGKIDIIWLVLIFVLLTLAAWIWRQFNRLSRGLLPSLASHLAADATVILAIYLLAAR